jgi:hypothetical protein
VGTSLLSTAHILCMLHADHEHALCVSQDFPIPEAKLIQLAQELFAKEAGVSDDSLLSDDFRHASLRCIPHPLDCRRPLKAAASLISIAAATRCNRVHLYAGSSFQSFLWTIRWVELSTCIGGWH